MVWDETDVGREKSGKVRVRQQGKYVKPDTWQAGKRECGMRDAGCVLACWRVGVWRVACGVWRVRRCRRIADVFQRVAPLSAYRPFRCRNGRFFVSMQGAGSRVRGCGENACLTGRGCKWLPVKGKGALFTELSTGNGDNVVPVPLQNRGAKFRGKIASGTVRQEPALRQRCR